MVSKVGSSQFYLNTTLKMFFILFIVLISSTSQSQESLLDRLNNELSPLTSLQKLYTIKLIENKITEQLKEIAQDQANKNDGYIWMTKVASFGYAALTFITEKQFSDLSRLYRDRTEIYTNYVRGKIEPAQLRNLEAQNENQKTILFERYRIDLSKTEKLTEEKAKNLIEIGSRLGLIISTHGKVKSTNN